ncbi:MAG: flagellar biosynthetic protein FliR [Chlamydiales bacterium]|nr:flagellar biosynthetic protein FliR [Chlamydiia bacterium]MCP5507926.1 flagellar biosynthetic protein FliR [Chlamydiales bacterium]
MSIFLDIFISSVFYDNPLLLLSMLFIFFGRMLPIIALSPFLGSRVLPHPVKIALALSLFTIFLPRLLTVTTIPPNFNFILLMYVIKEMFIGIILGTLMSLPFIIAQSAGMLIDHQRGGASLQVNDPTIQNQSSPLGTLFNMSLVYIFFLIDGPFLFLDAIMTSYELIPPDKFFNPAFFARDSLSWHASIKLFNQVMIMSVQLATPALIAILMTDSFLGLANRLAPQVQITFLGMPLKSLLGLTVVCLGYKLMVKQMISDSHYWLNAIAEYISMFGIGTTSI